ncbi:hypothetical protein THRCLA_23074 [Thraustotheca clavata]|uniref:Uncharacterized protein n=1 Tax=Thraustotheca clavata TaxID=74557 RepID=A0A1V9YFZ5_9STRA|nr:hypothetical protein THRCLA_23074 [Thraustotheca clavata]
MKDTFCRLGWVITMINAIEILREKYAHQIAHLIFIGAVIFSNLAIESQATHQALPHAERTRQLMKDGVHTFATSSLTNFSKQTFVLEQCIRLIERLAITNQYRMLLMGRGAVRQMRYIYNTMQHQGLLELCERVMYVFDKENNQ